MKTIKNASGAKKKKAVSEVAALSIKQGTMEFYLFSMSATSLWDYVAINQRADDKREGYQRALSPSRVKNVTKYIQNKGVIPGNIVVSLNGATYDTATSRLKFPKKPTIGWVIDGQHRLAGAFEAEKLGSSITLPVAAFLDLSLEKQIELFITINKEAKSVPASLYIDLLAELPKKKSDKELVDERIADITRSLNEDEQSPFFQRIIFTRTAKAGEVSLVNFARILRPHLTKPAGSLCLYTQIEQQGAINNYYKGLQNAFPGQFKDQNSVFFRTVGFGAVWRAFPIILNWCLGQYKAFTVAAVSKALAHVSDFDFASWSQLGTGTQAETQAGEDLLAALNDALGDEAGTFALKLE